MSHEKPCQERWVVLGSANGSTNLGDECMWEVAVDVLRTVRGDVQVVTDGRSNWNPPHASVDVMPYLYAALRRGYGVRPGILERALSGPGAWQRAYSLATNASLPTGRALALIDAWRETVRGAKGVIFSGAGALNDDFAVHGIASWYLIVRWARDAGVPVYFVGQGVGPISGRERTELASAALSGAELVTVREPFSLDIARDLGVSEDKLTMTPDWAFLNDPTHDDRVRAALLHDEHADGQSFIGLSVHRRGRTTRAHLSWLEEFCRRLAHEAIAQGLRVVVVPNMTGDRYNDDRTSFDMISESWIGGLGDNVSVLRTQESSRVVRALIGRSEGLLATRYHPVVFSLAESVGAGGISFDAYYDQKLAGCFRTFGCPENLVSVGSDADARAFMQTAMTMKVSAAPGLHQVITGDLEVRLKGLV